MSEETHKQPWWVETIKTLGLPTVFLVVIVFMLWRGGKWASTEVIMPLFQRQMVFIDTATKTLTDTQEAATEVKEGQEQGHASLKTISDAITELSADTKRVIDMLKDVEALIIESNAKNVK